VSFAVGGIVSLIAALLVWHDVRRCHNVHRPGRRTTWPSRWLHSPIRARATSGVRATRPPPCFAWSGSCASGRRSPRLEERSDDRSGRARWRGWRGVQHADCAERSRAELFAAEL